MNRIARIMSAAALFALAFTIAGASRAQAQIPNACCTFVMVASLNIPAACFPITMTTTWGGVAQVDVIPTSGVRRVYNITATNPCPPAATPLNSYSPDGGITTFTTAGPNAYTLLPCNFLVKFVVRTDPLTGCLEIHVTA